MTDDDARAWVVHHWGDAAGTALQRFAEMVVAENERQNLVSPSTTSSMWVRHLCDSAQLVPLAPDNVATWLDIGTGAGFPGIVVALLLPRAKVTLVEPRRRRVEFLQSVVDDFGLTNTIVEQRRVETLPRRPYAIITARAVARSTELIGMTSHLRNRSTRYILPRGRSGSEEVETLRTEWQGLFHVEHSLTDAESTIIVADGIA